MKSKTQRLIILSGFILLLTLITCELTNKTYRSIRVDMFYPNYGKTGFYNQSPRANGNWDNVIVRIDDGPDKYTSDIILTLKELGVKDAIFGLIGKNILEYPDAVKEILDAGYTIGNHTFSHPNMHKKSVRNYYESNPGKWIEQIIKTNKAINDALKPTGKTYQCKVFCCPEGSAFLSPFLRGIVKDQGLEIDKKWDIDSRDSIHGEKRLTQEQMVFQITRLKNKKSFVKVLIHSRKGGWSDQLREIDKILTNLHIHGKENG